MRFAPDPALMASGRDNGWFAFLWMTGTVLASVALALLATLQPLGVSGGAALAWVRGSEFQLTWAGEFLFFSVVAWGAGVVELGRTPAVHARPSHTIAVVALSVVLVAFIVLLLTLGRLVYPVIGADLSEEIVKLLVSVVFGTVHLAMLALAIAAFALPLPVQSVRAWRATRLLGILFGVLFVVGSYPWLLPTWMNVVVAAALGIWGVSFGISVLRSRKLAG